MYISLSIYLWISLSLYIYIYTHTRTHCRPSVAFGLAFAAAFAALLGGCWALYGQEFAVTIICGVLLYCKYTYTEYTVIYLEYH